MIKPSFALFWLVPCVVAAQAVPQWVTNPPLREGTNAVFVGSGSNEKGDEAAAEQKAWEAVSSQILSYIGVKIEETESLVTESTSRDSTETFRKAITSRSSSQIAGLRLGDRFVQKTGTTITVTLKALYSVRDLEYEKKRVQESFQEQNEAVSRLETEAGDLKTQGRVYQAIARYLEAAKASLVPGTDNAQIRFERAVGKARTAAQELRLEAVSGPSQGTAGQPLGEPFVARLRGLDSTPISGAAIRFSAKVPKGGRIFTVSATGLTDTQGRAQFDGLNAGAGMITVSASIDPGSLFDPFVQLSEEARRLLSALEDDLAKPRAQWSYRIVVRQQ